MLPVSVHLPEKLLKEIDSVADMLHMPRADYIRLALKKMNKDVLHTDRQRKLKRASLLTRRQSKAVNAEFDAIDGLLEL